METVTSGDGVVSVVPHHSRRKRKSVPAGHTPETDEKKLRKEEKKRRRLEAECTETTDLGHDADRGRGQGRTAEEEGQSTAQETTPRKKKKKKKEDIVVIDDEEKGDEHSEVPVVVETSITKKKKKHRNTTAEENAAVVTTNDDSQNTAGPLAQAKKLKKKSVVVTEAMDVAPDLGVERLEGQPVAGDSKRFPPSSKPKWLLGAPLEDVPFHKKKLSKGEMETQRLKKELREKLEMQRLTELKSYIPDIESRAPSAIRSMLRYDLKRFREFKQKGIALRMGRWLTQENMKIRENVADFLALTGIPSASHLFYPERHKEHGTESIKKIRVSHGFMERIADGIPRSCIKVYTRGRKIFDELNYLGRFTEEEVKHLKKLQQIHGNNWAAISKGMERSIYSLQKRFSMMKTVQGQWPQEESEVLEGIIKVHLEKLATENQAGADGAGAGPDQLWVTRRQLYHNLPWKSISEQVKGRSWVQCREKWFIILKPKMTTYKEVQRHGVQNVLPKITLINTLYGMGLEDPAEIDWEQVSECVGNVTPYTTQKMFNMLKITRVPHSSVLSYSEMIDFLHDKVVPMLRTKVALEELCPEESEEVQQRYMLSHLFSEEEFVELDLTARHRHLSHAAREGSTPAPEGPI